MPPELDRKTAAELRAEAAHHEATAKALREKAMQLDHRAGLDEHTPPTREERIDRILGNL